ncbi:TIGR01619 family protein [Actinobacillus seminis]|uniref:TIGR01619 family protein n=1 Tax=Actinobacillus seminis TaxID=722 RepID=UPI003B922DB5
MEIEQNWQNYRSMIKEKVAIFSVNLTLFQCYQKTQATHRTILQFSLPYVAEENGLPQTEDYQSLLKEMLRLSTLLSAQPQSVYVGYMLSDKQATLYFYCQDTAPLKAVLADFEQVINVSEQQDPNWDIYFDFLLPSPLEMKINATEEILDMLIQNGRSLDMTYLIEHTFHFPEEENMYLFLEYVATHNISVLTLKHTGIPIPLDEEERAFIVKLEQEVNLSGTDIFKYVEQFEEISSQFSGEYIGWESQELAWDKTQLN